jgi:hypothetical protein
MDTTGTAVWQWAGVQELQLQLLRRPCDMRLALLCEGPTHVEARCSSNLDLNRPNPNTPVAQAVKALVSYLLVLSEFFSFQIRAPSSLFASIKNYQQPAIDNKKLAN